MKVLIITSTLPRWKNDKTPAFVLDLAKSISQNYEKVFIVAPHYKNARTKEDIKNIHILRYRYFWPASKQDIVYEGGGINKVNLANPFYIVKLLLLIIFMFMASLKTILLNNISTINAHWILPQGFVGVILKKITKKKLVVTVHGSDIFSLNGPLQAKIKKFVLTSADTVVVNSSATHRACLKISPNSIYKKIPMGTDSDLFKDSGVRRSANFTVLFVGRVSEEKGLIHLVRAIKRLRDDKINIHLNVVGDGPEMKNIKDYIKKNKLEENTNLLGWIAHKELQHHYARSTVLAGPSLREAFGLVFVEALMCGLPVIGTKVGGIPDIIKHEKNGLLVSPGSSTGLSIALRRLYNDKILLELLSVGARKSAINSFSWESVSQRYIKVLGTSEGQI